MSKTFDKDMAELASAIVAKAQDDDITLAEMTDAFKVLTPYFVALRKGRKPDEDDTETSMAGLISGIEEASQEDRNGAGPSVRGGRGRTHN